MSGIVNFVAKLFISSSDEKAGRENGNYGGNITVSTLSTQEQRIEGRFSTMETDPDDGLDGFLFVQTHNEGNTLVVNCFETSNSSVRRREAHALLSDCTSFRGE